MNWPLECQEQEHKKLILSENLWTTSSFFSDCIHFWNRCQLMLELWNFCTWHFKYNKGFSSGSSGRCQLEDFQNSPNLDQYSSQSSTHQPSKRSWRQICINCKTTVDIKLGWWHHSFAHAHGSANWFLLRIILTSLKRWRKLESANLETSLLVSSISPQHRPSLPQHITPWWHLPKPSQGENCH